MEFDWACPSAAHYSGFAASGKWPTSTAWLLFFTVKSGRRQLVYCHLKYLQEFPCSSLAEVAFVLGVWYIRNEQQYEL